LRRVALGGQFTTTSIFHVTLVFVGDVSNDCIEKISTLVETTRFFPFVIKTKQLGFFQTKGLKDILVWNIERNTDLTVLQRHLIQECRALGFVLEEREYRPHFTLARQVRFPEAFELGIDRFPITALYMRCDRLSLMESTRVNGTLTYREIVGKTMASPSDRTR
jgi:2'-5' RNA ligase